jgi:hypothetical protein
LQAVLSGAHLKRMVRIIVQIIPALLLSERRRATVFGQRLPASGRQSRRPFSQIDN